jgi:hypothetical protein
MHRQQLVTMFRHSGTRYEVQPAALSQTPHIRAQRFHLGSGDSNNHLERSHRTA